MHSSGGRCTAPDSPGTWGAPSEAHRRIKNSSGGARRERMGPRDHATSALTIHDAAPLEIVGRKLDRHAVARKNPDKVSPHASGNLTQRLVLYVAHLGLYEEHRVGQGLRDDGIELDNVRLCHTHTQGRSRSSRAAPQAAGSFTHSIRYHDGVTDARRLPPARTSFRPRHRTGAPPAASGPFGTSLRRVVCGYRRQSQGETRGQVA